jgi:hypothetical protein
MVNLTVQVSAISSLTLECAQLGTSTAVGAALKLWITQTNLDANDILRYIIFTNLADTTGSIIATSTTPTFPFNPAIMQTGVIYYLAALAGNGVNGNVDISDPCLDV